MDQKLLLAATAEPISQDQAKCHLRVDGSDDDALILSLIRAARMHAEGYTHRAFVRQTWRVTLRWFPSVIELPVMPVRSVTSVQYVDTAGVTQTLAVALYQVDLTTSDRVLIMPAFGETWPSTRGDTFDAVTIEFVAGHAIPFKTDFGTDNQLDATAHPLSNGDVLQAWNTGGGLPDGLSTYTNYYVVNAATDAIELSLTSGGAAVTLSDDGTGTHFVGLIPEPLISAMLLLIGHLYENREQSILGALNEIPMGIESLLLPYASVRF